LQVVPPTGPLLRAEQVTLEYAGAQATCAQAQPRRAWRRFLTLW
jgi:hypothetical protein